MSMFDSHSREQLRQSYRDAWRKQLSGALLSPLEAMLADVIGAHPEYQPVLQDAHHSPPPGPAPQGENPFLHMGLHMAVREQVAIDRPPGVRELHDRLRAASSDAHGAEHLLMEALGETLWEAQRAGSAPDEARYMERIRRLAPVGFTT